MLDMPIHIPLWLVLVFLAMCAAFLFLSGVGTYYLISKKFDKNALIITASIILALMIPKSLNPYHWAEIVRLYSDLVSLTGLVLTFLAVFSVVNFIYRLVCKISLK